MKKAVRKIVDEVIEIADECDVDVETALNILSIAAGGADRIPDFIENEEDDDCECECDHNCDEDGDEDVPEVDEDDNDDEYDEEDDEEEEIVEEYQDAVVGRGNRLTIPSDLIRVANYDADLEDDDEITVVRYPETIEVVIGDATRDYEHDKNVKSISIIHPNAGSKQVTIKVAPTFETGQTVRITATDDGLIYID